LRGRILQATAPASFRMEDYKKVSREQSPIYKWGFYAAALFLMAGAWFNISMQQKNARLNTQVAQADQRAKVLEHTLATVVTPSVKQINFVTDNDSPKLWARAWVNDVTHDAIVMLPQDLVTDPSNAVQLTMCDVKYQTVMLTGSAELFPDKLPPGTNPQLTIHVNEKNLLLDNSSPMKVYTASK